MCGYKLFSSFLLVKIQLRTLTACLILTKNLFDNGRNGGMTPY